MRIPYCSFHYISKYSASKKDYLPPAHGTREQEVVSYAPFRIQRLICTA